MQTKDIQLILKLLNFIQDVTHQHIHQKHINGYFIQVDTVKETIIYPKKIQVNDESTCNFAHDENFIVLECVHRLLEKGYKPEHIELEPKWQVGHGASGGKADILVKDNAVAILIIECKTAKEFDKAWNKTLDGKGQILTYYYQERTVKHVCLYTSEIIDDKVEYKNHIICLIDDEKLPKHKSLCKLYKDAQNAKDVFKVWHETYDREFSTDGIFEPNVQPYQVGILKKTVDDLIVINSSDFQKKYNEFAEILRKHNVSSKESAFDKLINLFLCKIVDETKHNPELQFKWHGKVDTPFKFIDRLQQLYHDGMKDYLGETITFIKESDITYAFTFHRDKNVIRDAVMKLFNAQKYYTASDFGFIDVHNEKLFKQNFAILLDVVKAWQDLRLTSENQNQFLGDLFEGFLDKGFKQSEGQFFTPIPICKFIVSSLPLSDKPQKVIDYACGSGHFLTEYAAQIRTMISGKTTLENETEKQYKFRLSCLLNTFYENIFGVEKEYRLSKVAKISAFMYGQNAINVIYCDALKPIQQEISNKIILVPNNSFDVLIANPPFAVEGFLSTLSEEERQNYTLFSSKIDVDTQRNIQCFFLERAKQLLNDGGIMGVIVPSSILSTGDDIHTKTRELLLQYFSFIAIVELGNTTFGKTGTNTVVLFLRRRSDVEAERAKQRAEDFFRDIDRENDDRDSPTNRNEYRDAELIKNYCKYIKVEFEQYYTLLKSEQSQELLQAEHFRDYKLPKNSKIKLLIDFIREKEAEKLFYFILTHQQKTLVVKCNPDKPQEFLGYEWSGAKGREGIKYYGGNSINTIKTPLFDPNNRENPDKINYIIQQRFLGKTVEHDSEYVTELNLIDMLDLSRIEFNKIISLKTKKVEAVESKWGLVRLGEVAEVFSGSRPKGGAVDNGVLSIGGEHINYDGSFNLSNPRYVPDEFFNSLNQGKIEIGDVLIVKDGATTGKTGYFDGTVFSIGAVNEHVFIVRSNANKLLSFYLYQYLKSDKGSADILKHKAGAVQGGINLSINIIKIPLPPLNIQQNIVDECLLIENAVNTAKQNIKDWKTEIGEMVKRAVHRCESVRLGEVCKELFAGGDAPQDHSLTMTTDNNIPIYANGIENQGLYGFTNKATVHEPAITISARGTLGYSEIRYNPFVPIVRLIVLIPNDKVELKYLKLAISDIEFVDTGAVIPQLTIPKIKYLKIPLPPLQTQQQLINDISIIEKQITSAELTISSANEKRREVMEKWL